MSLCECGCGEEAKPGNRFIYGHNMKGIPHSPKHNAAISAAKMGHEVSDKTRAAISKSKKGIPLSPEACAAMSKALSGIPKPPRTPEHCAALSRANMGHIVPDEIRAKISDTMRGGNDIVNHHYTYDESDLSKYTVKMTRSDHARLHCALRKLGYVVPHINSRDEGSCEARGQ